MPPTRAAVNTFPHDLIDDDYFVSISIPAEGDTEFVDRVFLWMNGEGASQKKLYIKYPYGKKPGEEFELFVGQNSIYETYPTSGATPDNPII